jgi:hypothetical protein
MPDRRATPNALGRQYVHNFRIDRTLCAGEFDDPQDQTQLLEQANQLPDKACAGNIVGENLLLTADRQLVHVTLEATVSGVDVEYAAAVYADVLKEAGVSYCPNCGSWFIGGSCIMCTIHANVQEKEFSLSRSAVTTSSPARAYVWARSPHSMVVARHRE